MGLYCYTCNRVNNVDFYNWFCNFHRPFRLVFIQKRFSNTLPKNGNSWADYGDSGSIC